MERLITSFFVAVIYLSPTSAHAINEGQSTWFASSDIEQVARQYTVRLIRVDKRKKETFICSAIAYSPTEVVSAAHCFGDDDLRRDLNRGNVIAEIYDPTAKTKTRRIQVTLIDKIQDEKTDLALLGLQGESPIQQSLPVAYAGCDEESEYVSSGFGFTEYEKSPSKASTAHYRSLTSKEVLDLSKVNVLKRNALGDKNWKFLRASKGNSCPGDSGGPVFCKSKGLWAIAGLNSAGTLGKMSLSKENLSAEVVCKNSDLLRVNKMGPNMQLIEKWRSKSRESSASTNGTK